MHCLFINILGVAIRSVINGTIPPKEALAYAQSLAEKAFVIR